MQHIRIQQIKNQTKCFRCQWPGIQVAGNCFGIPLWTCVPFLKPIVGRPKWILRRNTYWQKSHVCKTHPMQPFLFRNGAILISQKWTVVDLLVTQQLPTSRTSRSDSRIPTSNAQLPHCIQATQTSILCTVTTHIGIATKTTPQAASEDNFAQSSLHH